MSKAAKVAGSLAAMMALVGCASGNPQVAAYVGAETVPQSRVDAIATVLAQATEDPADVGATYGQTVVTLLVQAKIAAQVGAAKGITVTDAQRQEVYDSNALYQVLRDHPVTADFMANYADTALIVTDEVGKAAFAEQLLVTPVTLNPRFGTWDAAQGAVAEGSSGSISELAAATK